MTDKKDLGVLDASTAEVKIKRIPMRSAALRKTGAIVSSKGVQKVVRWEHDEEGTVEFEVYVKRHTMGKYLDMHSKRDQPDSVKWGTLISESLFEDEECKKRVFTIKDACDLSPDFSKLLSDAVEEVNQGNAKKNH